MPTVSQRVPRRTFEALLRPEVVTLSPTMLAGLRELRVDPQHLEPTYELPTLRAAIALVARVECAALPEDEALREVGRRFVQGFKQTPIGWIFNRMAPFFGPSRTIQELPRYLTSVREEFPLSVVAEGDTRFRLISEDPDAHAPFMAGCVEGVLLTCGVPTSSVKVITTRAGFELEISW